MNISSSQPKYSLPTRPVRFIVAMSKPYAVWAWAAIVCSVIAQTLATSVAFVFRGLVDSATRFSGGQEMFAIVLLWAIAYPAVVTLAEVFWRASGFTGMFWSTGLRKNAYSTLFEYLSRHSSAFFSRKFAGALGSAMNNATNGMGTLAESFLWNYLPTVVAAVVTIALAVVTNLYLGIVFFFWIALVIPVNLLFAKRIARYSQESAANQSKLRGFTVDIIANIAAVHSFARRSFEASTIDTAAGEQRKFALRSWITSELLLSVNSIFLALFSASVVGVAFYLWHGNVITLGELIMSLTLAGNITWVVLFIGAALNGFATNIGEIKNGLTDIIVAHEIHNAEDAKALPTVTGSISFQNVSFGYDRERPIFKDFSLAIKAGERVGIVGPSGSGKTTLVSLLLRYHDVQAGSVRVDGNDVRQITLESLREAISFVPQDSLLFHRTLKENIGYGKLSAADREIEEAARKAQAHGFISVLPQGYDTLVGERGVKLSGGQRQRIAIARAILKAAPILVLDEATSSLDSESESDIQQALQELMKGKTVLAIAHRLSTIRAMDRIIVLEDGAIVEDGAHNALLKKEGGVYARLWAHQAGGFLKTEEGENEEGENEDSN